MISASVSGLLIQLGIRLIIESKSVPGCNVHEVDHSSVISGGQGESPTPQNRFLFPEKKQSPTLTGLIDFFDQGVEGSTPVPPKSGGVFDSDHARKPNPRRYLEYHTANLDLWGLEKRPTKTCIPKFIVYKCECGRHIVPSTCMSLNCTSCAGHTGKRRSKNVFDRLTFFKGNREKFRRVIYTVLTVPESVRNRYRNPKTWQLARRRAWKMIKKNFGGVFGVECSHPTGDSSNAFHPHLNFLWIQRKGYSGFINVKVLRREWQKIIGTENSVVNTQYAGNHAQVKHWCNYVTRTFPGYHWWTGSMRWYGKYPTRYYFPENVCAICETPFIPLGYILKVEVDDYYSAGWLMGRDPPWYDDSRIVPFKKRKKGIDQDNTGTTPVIIEDSVIVESQLSLYRG